MVIHYNMSQSCLILFKILIQSFFYYLVLYRPMRLYPHQVKVGIRFYINVSFYLTVHFFIEEEDKEKEILLYWLSRRK